MIINNNNKILSRSIFLLVLLAFFIPSNISAAGVEKPQSTRKERRCINAGNKLYREGKFAKAIQQYNQAIAENPGSVVARFNLGLGQIRMAGKNTSNDTIRNQLMQEGSRNLSIIAGIGKAKADLSSKANYNLGNLKFEQQDYGGAIQYYKEALRLNPQFNDARHNLRIAQLKQQQSQDNQNRDQNNEQEKEQEQNKEQEKEQQQEQQQDQQQQQQDQQEQNSAENEISKQAATQILNAIENNEAQTRARKGNNEANKAGGATQTLRKW